jgi:hypothetical protein
MDVDGKIILKIIFEKYNCGEEWIRQAQGRGEWRILVNKVIKPWVAQDGGNC